MLQKLVPKFQWVVALSSTLEASPLMYQFICLPVGIVTLFPIFPFGLGETRASSAMSCRSSNCVLLNFWSKLCYRNLWLCFSNSQSDQMYAVSTDRPLQARTTLQTRIQFLAVFSFDLKIMAIHYYVANSASSVRQSYSEIQQLILLTTVHIQDVLWFSTNLGQ